MKQVIIHRMVKLGQENLVMHKVMPTLLLFVLSPFALGVDQCVGDYHSGNDSPAYRKAFGVLSSRSEGADAREKKKEAMAVIHAEAVRGNFFAAIFENAIFQSKGLNRKAATDHMPIEVRQNGKCDGATYVFSLAAVPTYLGATLVNGHWAYPNLSTWMKSGDPYNVREAAKWLVGLNATYGSNIWRESFENVYRLGKCKNLTQALDDAEKIYVAAPQDWKTRLDESRAKVEKSCASTNSASP